MIAETGGGDDNVPSDVADALRHNRRHEIVDRLSEADDDLSLVTLASQCVADTDDTLPTVVLELHNVHIPELTDCGLVEYDDDTGAVTLAANPEVVEAALETTKSSTDR